MTQYITKSNSWASVLSKKGAHALNVQCSKMTRPIKGKIGVTDESHSSVSYLLRCVYEMQVYTGIRNAKYQDLKLEVDSNTPSLSPLATMTPLGAR